MSNGAAIPTLAPGVGDLGTQTILVHANVLPDAKRDASMSPVLRNETAVASPVSHPAADNGGSETHGRQRPRLAAAILLTSAAESPIPRILDESDRRRTRSITRHDGPRKSTGEFAAEIRIGPSHQATLPVMSCDDNNDDDDDVHDADVLWDPALFGRQSSAVRERALALIGRERRLESRMLMMECLTANAYDADAARSDFDRRTALRSTSARGAANESSANDLADCDHAIDWSAGPPFPWPHKEVAIFESAIEREGLQVSAIAEAVGRPKVEILANCYWWKARKRIANDRGGNDDSDHSRTSSQQSDDDAPDECFICHQRGFLIICGRCREAYHLDCLDPPLDRRDIPKGDWYCHKCAFELPVPLKLLDTVFPQKPRDTRLDAATRRRLLDTQKVLTCGSRGVQSTKTSNNAHQHGGKGKLGHSCFGEEIHSHRDSMSGSSGSPQAPTDSAENDSDDSSTSESDANAFDESDNNHSPSSSVSLSPEKPALERKRGRGSDSDESSYRVSESDGGSDSDENVGTVSNADRAVILPTAVSGEQQARDRSAEYTVNVPFRFDGSLGLHVAWNHKKNRAIVDLASSQQEETIMSSNGTGGWFRGANDVILRVDGEDTNMKDDKVVMDMCTRRAEGQQFKQFVMLHEHDHERGSDPSCLSNEITTIASLTGNTPFASLSVPSDANVGQVAVSCRPRNAGSAFHSVESNHISSTTTQELPRPFTSVLAVQAQGRGPPIAPAAGESILPKSRDKESEVIDLTNSPPSSPKPFQAGEVIDLTDEVIDLTGEVIDLTGE